MAEVIKVLVFGTIPSCMRCLQAEKEARLAAESFPPGRVIVEKHNAMGNMGIKFGIMLTPTVIINGKTVAVGKVLKQSELVELIKIEVGIQ